MSSKHVSFHCDSLSPLLVDHFVDVMTCLEKMQELMCINTNTINPLPSDTSDNPGTRKSQEFWCGHRPAMSAALWLRWDKFTWTTESCGGKGTAQLLSQGESALECLGHSLKTRAPWPLPWQAFIAFLGTLHWGWSSFTMHRFALGGYLSQKTKERMLLITSKKKDICKYKGKSGWTGYTCPWKV